MRVPHTDPTRYSIRGSAGNSEVVNLFPPHATRGSQQNMDEGGSGISSTQARAAFPLRMATGMCCPNNNPRFASAF